MAQCMRFGLGGKLSSRLAPPPNLMRIFSVPFRSLGTARTLVGLHRPNRSQPPTRENRRYLKVEDRHAPSAIAVIGGGSAAEPWTATAKMARRPHDRHVLFNRLPLSTFATAGTKIQDHLARFNSYTDGATRLSVLGP